MSTSAVVSTPQQQPQAPAQESHVQESQAAIDGQAQSVGGFGGMGEGGNPLSGKFPPTSMHGGWIQAKLEIGAVDDPLEREADAMADKVMRMPLSGAEFAGISSPVIQRKCADCEQEDEKLQRKSVSNNGGGFASPQLSSQITSTRGGGLGLDTQTRGFMENGFGRDFSSVKIHTGSYAGQMNRDLNARAFTIGNDIYFNQGQYQPAAESGRRLLAHELTHVVQQGDGISKKANTIQRDALDDRAAREAAAGQPALQNALGAAMSNYLPFSFTTNLEGTTRITVRQGGGLRLVVNSNFVDPAVVATPTNNQFTITLMEDVTGFDTSHGAASYTVGTAGRNTWSSLPAGNYYIVFAKTSSEAVSGNVWVDTLSGAGEVASATSTADQFEVSTGINPSLHPVSAVAYGQYALRSEPTSNSFIYGTLPGVPTNITVIDKRSFSRTDPTGNASYYKIQFSTQAAYRANAIRVPAEVNSDAMALYNLNQAWVTEGALKIYVPYNLLLQQIRNFEAQASVSSMTVAQRVTHLRQLHQDPVLPYDQIIGTPAGTRSVADRPELSNLVQMLKGPVTGVIGPDGRMIDFAHFLITMDAYQHPDTAATFSPNFLVPSTPIGSSRAVMSWSGDVGGAVGNYTVAHEDRGLAALNTALLDEHFERSAPDADLLGNLDGVQASALLSTGTITSLEGLVRLYYEGIATGPTSSNPNAVNTQRAAALTTFLGSYGFGSATGLTNPSAARNCILVDAGLFGLIWYRNVRGWSTSQIAPPITALVGARDAMSDRFLRRLEYFATLYGVTTIPPTSVRAANCTAPPVTVPATTTPAVTPTPTPIIRRKVEGSGQVAPAKNTHSLQRMPQLTAAPLQIQKQEGGGTPPTPPTLRSVIFRNSPTLVAAYNRGTVHLSRTSGGADSITLLQQAFLFLDPHGVVRATTGSYGPQTESAVSDFQTRVMHLPTPTGEVDPATLLAIDNAVATMQSVGPDAPTSASGTLPRRFTDYPRTYISQIDVDLTSQTILLTWAGPTAASRPRGSFECSTGGGVSPAGNCFDCDDLTVSTTPSTYCTPKGTFQIQSFASSLPSFPEALFVSYFEVSRGVAFHYYPNVPRSPASHGCVRLHLYPAILIQDNVIAGTTNVNVTGTWSQSWSAWAQCEASNASRRLRQLGRSAYDSLPDWPF